MKQSIFSIFLVIFIVGITVGSFTFKEVQKEKNSLRQSLQLRTTLLAENARDHLESYIIANSEKDLPKAIDSFVNSQKITGIVLYNNKNAIIASSSGLPKSLDIRQLAETVDKDKNGQFEKVGGEDIYEFSSPLHDSTHNVIGSLVLIQNASYIDTTVSKIGRENFLWFLLYTTIISVAILLILFWLIYQPVRNLVRAMKRAQTGTIEQITSRFSGNFFLQPLIREVTNITKSLKEARLSASQEARLRIEKLDSPWTAERLKEFTKDILKGRQIFVVSNREPYIHTRQGNTITYHQPASGMVTAIEPIMHACGGMWIAHGSGSGDKATVDANDTISVPLDDPKYTLKRVWMTQPQEKGFYTGFCNEGLWPLCHMAHTQPVFRKEDWEEYKAVNGKFAQVLLKEIKDVSKPIILIQDFHFAILPRMIKLARPDAIIGIFWHIPWPNSEAFRICPWRKELLDGMLGTDLIGFHTQLHCNNFIDTVSRELEALVDMETFAVQRKEHISQVKPFPISVPFSDDQHSEKDSISVDRAKLLKELHIKSKYIGIGVDRLDYTKGILERLRAVEHFFKLYPHMINAFTFIQVGAPSRTSVADYQRFEHAVEKEVQRINASLQINDWKPIVLLKRHHSHEEVTSLYRIADVCLVTSLHDGMNLVAKEFVMARSDEKGVLILSQFAGASQELKDALIVNPYSTEQMAEAINTALTMMHAEQVKLMRRLRSTVINYNLYRWAADLLKALVGTEE